MDLLISKTSKIMELALDGLAERHKAISSNIANANTIGYTRQDVVFENQLQDILAKENLKSSVKLKNSYPDMVALNAYMNASVVGDSKSIEMIMKNDNFKSYDPEVIIDTDSPEISNGNNVNVESEMVQLSKNGTKYNALTQLESRYFRKIENLIKGANNI